jgi:hypothetical protein
MPTDFNYTNGLSKRETASSLLGICAVFKNEARYLREFLEFHRMVGVDKFFLYNNGSTDDWWEVLHPYFDAGIVQVVSMPGTKVQLPAYFHAMMAWGPMVRWMAFLDVDEFLFSPHMVRLPDVLADYMDVGSVGACWQVYGTGGRMNDNYDLVTKHFQWRSASVNLSRHVKSIVRMARAIHQIPMDPHHFVVDGASVDELRRPLEGPLAQSPTHEILRVNHYYSKSEVEARAKMKRSRADNGELRTDDLLSDQLNKVYDPTILPWADQLKERLWISHSR